MRAEKIKAQPFDCMQYFYTEVQEPRIRCFIRFGDRISETALNRAVGLSIHAVPLIGCVFNEKRHCWEKRSFTADDIVHFVEAPAADEIPVPDCLLCSIDPAREPQLKIFLIRGKRNDSLCFIINHMICDGAGFKDYLYLLCNLYTKCEIDAGYNRKPEPFGKRGLGQLLKNLSFKQKLEILLSKPHYNKPDPAMIMPIKGGADKPMIVVAKIEKEQFAAIRARAKSRQVSVNDALLTAYIRAVHRATGCREITIPCPVNLRKYRKAEQRCGICNLTANYICSVDVDPEEPVDVTLRKVSVRMRAQKESNECLKKPMLFHITFHLLPFKTMWAIFRRNSPVPVTSYTNIGVLDDGRLHFGAHNAEDAFISTAVKKHPYFQLSVSTYNGSCTLTSSLYGTKEDRGFIENCFGRIIEELVLLPQ
ncbi:MAG TPA: hypothetical protein VHR42_02490 [Clostridia bacterium]|nr:hypothetical protein [Clostridia bacterium]